jgi:DNA-binding phage protein
MTAITKTMSLQEAKTHRDAELLEAKVQYAEACRRINEAFAVVVHHESETRSMSEIANSLGMNRTRLYEVVGKPVAA